MEPSPMRPLLVLLALAAHAAADVSLTPVSSEMDEYKFTVLLFSDGGKKISYRVPKDWTCWRIGSDKIRFSPHNVSQAESEIVVEPLVQPFPFDEEGIKKLEERARRLVPKDALQVELIAGQPNPVLIGGPHT